MLHPHHDQPVIAARPARTLRWSAFAVAITLAAFLAAWSVLPSPAEAATTYYVEAGATGVDCSEATPCATIAEALVLAADGDTIMIADGTYTEPGLQIKDAVTLQGTSMVGTIIQAAADDSAVTNRVLLVVGGAGDVAINDLTVQHGYIGGAANGGGLAVHSGNEVTLTRVHVTDNTATGRGGGVSNNGGTLFVIDSRVSENAAGDDGGGISNNDGNITLSNSTVAGNQGSFGGGIATNGGKVTVRDGSVVGGAKPAEANKAGNGGGVAAHDGETLIDGASVVGNIATNYGGGIFAFAPGESLTVLRSVLEGNSAESGGGLFAEGPASVSLSYSRVVGNTASRDGDAIFDGVDEGYGARIQATHNWWGSADGPAAGAIFNLGTDATTTFAPWLTSLELTADPPTPTEGDPVEVTATLRDSEGSDVSEQLRVRFSHTSGLPHADVPFGGPGAAVHTFAAVEGVDTITATVLFAGQESTLTGTTFLTAVPRLAAPRDLPADDPPTTLTEGDLELALAPGCFEEAEVPASGDLVLSTGNGCGEVEVTAPEGSLPSGHTLVLGVPADLDDLPTANGDAAHRLAFILQLQDEDGEVMTGDLDGPVTVTVGIPPEPVHPNELLVSYWDGEAWVDVLAEVVGAADGSFALTFEVDHFTLFAAQEDPGRGQLTPEPASSGTSLARWGGGSTSLLPAAKSYWVTSEGRFLAYSPGGPAFVNEAFLSQWPDGIIPEGTLLIVVR